MTQTTTSPQGTTATSTTTARPTNRTTPTLTFIVPAYNMEEYLERCVTSLLQAHDTSDIEVLIVDDGSHDSTPQLADTYAKRWPANVRAIHQPNKGHGGAVNTGIANARGTYVKVVDADDWIDSQSIDTMMDTLREQTRSASPVDMVVSNYVYDKVGKRRLHTVNFRHAMKPNTVLTWDDLGHFGLAEYILMHALTFRTAVVRESGMVLPEHTFYVDFIYAYQPFTKVRTMIYLDMPYYHYFIGREGQSVQTDVMIRRVDQLILVNERMTEATPEPGTVPDGLYQYMIHFLTIESCVASVFLILSRDPENYEKKRRMWAAIEVHSAAISRDVRRKVMARAINLPGPVGRWIIRHGYVIAERVVGFN